MCVCVRLCASVCVCVRRVCVTYKTICLLRYTCYHDGNFLFQPGDRLQELERLKAEVESANEFQTQKDSLAQKLKVNLNAQHHRSPCDVTQHTCLVPK